MRILVIEDEPKVGAFLKRGLEEQNHRVDIVHDGTLGWKSILSEEYDQIILDIMLPGMDGLRLCENIRAKQVQTPILMLTALNAISDIVNGLNAGADDYLSKPFHFSELLARIDALARRKHIPYRENALLQLGDLQLNTNTRIATRQGKEIILTPREYALLELFLQRAGRVLSRTQISEAVWGLEFDTGTNTIDVYVNYLRNKIERDFSGERLIHTVIGVGYVMRIKS